MTQTEHNNQYESQQKLSFLGFILELLNFVWVTVSALFSGSLIVWMDFIDSLCNVADAGLVTLLSRKLKQNLKYEYNYGIGKIEAISSLCCEGILIFGLMAVFASSIYELANPKQPSELLIYVVILKVLNVLGDVSFLRKQQKITKARESELTTAKFYSELKNLVFDAAALLSIFVCWVFRGYRASWYFSPVICIVIVCVFFVSAVMRMKKSVTVLTDRTLPEKEQLKILKVLSKFNDRYEEFGFLSSRVSGETTYIDLSIRFSGDTPYERIKTLCREISAEAEKQIPNSRVSIVIGSEGI